jgi:hypothetical protein
VIAIERATLPLGVALAFKTKQEDRREGHYFQISRVLPFTLLVVLASSIGGDRLLWNRSLSRPQPHQKTGDEIERLVTALPVMTKSRGPSWGRNNCPENGLVKPPRRDTRSRSSPQPSRYMFREKAPPRLAAQMSRPRAHLEPIHSTPAFFPCKWGV